MLARRTLARRTLASDHRFTASGGRGQLHRSGGRASAEGPLGVSGGMGEESSKRAVTTRLIRGVGSVHPGSDWPGTTPEERIEAVWELTLLCLAWREKEAGEPRLEKSLGRARDLLAEFNAQGVEFLVVGAHALAAHGHVRATKDLDVWVRPTAENAARVIRALRSFGAPLQDLETRDLTEPGTIFQIGVAPVRIDIVTSISGVRFDEAWPRRLCTRFADQPVGVLSREDLIRNKRAAGRTQDLADAEWLEAHRPGE